MAVLRRCRWDIILCLRIIGSVRLRRDSRSEKVTARAVADEEVRRL